LQSVGNIYFIGHRGFIGQQVVPLILNNRGIFLSREDFENISTGQKHIDFSPDDILLNLAWDNLDNFRSPLHLTQTLGEHIRFYNSVLGMGLKNITTIGTCLEYGVVEGELEEELHSNPSLPYSIAKDSLRKYLDYQKNNGDGFNFNWIRLFYVYGEGQSKRTIFGQLVEAVEKKSEVFDMSLGKQKRDYLHVRDVASIIYQIANGHESHGIVNCCSTSPVEMVDFVNQRLKEFGYVMKLNLGKYPYPTYEGMNFWGSVKKLNRILGK
jgi:nucleoside-diphosphate-sugar epimerase